LHPYRKGSALTEISKLRAARELAGLTVEQVAKKTNIRAGVIEDLEKNSVDVCGGIAYARGHIRSIAKVIKADGDLLVAEIEAAQGDTSRRIIDALYDNNVADRPKVKKVMKFSTLAGLAAAVLGIGFVVNIAINNVSSSNESQETVATSSPSPSATSDATNVSGVNLTVTAVDGRTWLGITNEQGETVFDGQIKSGESKSFQDSDSLRVSIGNASAVRITLNGVDLGVAGGFGEVARYKYTQAGATKE
jgi:cytoskeletal protein RodZ